MNMDIETQDKREHHSSEHGDIVKLFHRHVYTRRKPALEGAVLCKELFDSY